MVTFEATHGVVTEGHSVLSLGWMGSGEWLAAAPGRGSCSVCGVHKDSAAGSCHAAAKWIPSSRDLGLVPFLPYHLQF